MEKQVSISARFNGPPDSANGGYCCGALAAHIDGPARVRLHAPPPLETTLIVSLEDDGVAHLRGADGDLGSAFPCDLDFAVPAAPGLDVARAARAGFIGLKAHTLPTCFVCGPGRERHDGLELFTGPVPGTELVACNWLPQSDLLSADGTVRPEFVWSALDCPGYFAVVGDTPIQALLGELSAEIIDAVPGDEELQVYAWPIEHKGRRRVAGCAIANDDGDVLARSRSVWIELKAPT